MVWYQPQIILRRVIILAVAILSRTLLFQKASSLSGSESDASVVLEMNEKLLEAHKKVVQKNLRSEVARDICSSDEDDLADKNKTNLIATDENDLVRN